MNKDANIKIQALEKEYNVILKQYEEAYNNYINNLSEADFSIKSDSKFQLLLLNGISNNTVCSSDSNISNNIGMYTNDDCAKVCEQDPECSGYQVTNKDMNNNYACGIFKNEVVNAATGSGDGCYAKINSVYYTPPTQTETTVATNTNFVTLKGRTYWGSSGISEGTAETAEECETMCASDTKCTGATFNEVKRYCWTRTGNGNMSTGTDNDYAIVPKLRQNMIILQNLNTRLININNQLSSELRNVYPVAKENIVKSKQKQQELSDYYGNLLKEQQMIEQMIQEYMSVEEEYNNQSLYVNQQNMVLKIWVLIAFILLVVAITKMFRIPLSSFTFIIMIVILAVLFSFHY